MSSDPKMSENGLVKGKNKRRVFWEEKIYEKILGKELDLRNWKRASAPEVQGRSV